MLALGACQPQASEPPRPRAAPVHVPDGLLADVVTPNLQACWDALRSQLGKTGAWLPEPVALAVVQLLGVPPLMAGRFQSERPAHAAVAFDGPELEWVAALPITSGREFAAELATGSGAPFRVRGTGRILHLDGRTRSGAALGVSGQFLLIGSSSEAIDRLGAFVVQQRAQVPALGQLLAKVTPRAAIAALTSAYLDRAPLGAGRSTGSVVESERFDVLAESAADALLDEVGELTRGELVATFQGSDLVVTGSFERGADLQAAASTAQRVPSLCEVMRALPGNLAAGAVLDADVSADTLRELVNPWLPVAQVSAPPAWPDLAGPVALGWAEESAGAAFVLSYKEPAEPLERTLRPWLAFAQTRGPEDVRRAAVQTQLFGPGRPVEWATLGRGGRRHLAVGAHLERYFREAAAGAPDGSVVPRCEPSDRVHIWVNGYGELAFGQEGSNRNGRARASLSRIVALLMPEASR